MTGLNNFLCFSMRSAMKKIERGLGGKMLEQGISIPQWFILNCLLEEDGITLKEIGHRSLIDSSSMTVLVDKLEREGLVERRLDPQDRRAIRIFILPKGKQIGEEADHWASEFNALLYDLLGECNQKEFVHGINNIIKGLD
ncbi:MAG TPA: MarR family transcriptional regulator [Syntrophomonadaceae bacterium]|nr:MarR family transcriptional regulator [Syntrophomonadaceae bacterium]